MKFVGLAKLSGQNDRNADSDGLPTKSSNGKPKNTLSLTTTKQNAQTIRNNLQQHTSTLDVIS